MDRHEYTETTFQEHDFDTFGLDPSKLMGALSDYMQ